MPFELGSAFNGGAEWVCGSPVVFGVLRNPVLTALMITALALIIIHTMFKDEIRRSGWRKGFKAGFWMLIGISALVFIHYYALERSLKRNAASQGIRTVIDSIHHSAAVGGGYSVFGDEESDEPPVRKRADNVSGDAPGDASGDAPGDAPGDMSNDMTASVSDDTSSAVKLDLKPAVLASTT